jgi:hypothetical protein
MPMPMPGRTRYSIKVFTSFAVAQSKLPAPQSTMLDWKTRRRPNRSASRPEAAAPISMPRKLALPSKPADAVLSASSALIEPRTNVISPRSIESKSHAVAMMRKSLV